MKEEAWYTYQTGFAASLLLFLWFEGFDYGTVSHIIKSWLAFQIMGANIMCGNDTPLVTKKTPIKCVAYLLF